MYQALDKAKAKIIDIDNKYEISKKVEKSYEYGKDALMSALGKEVERWEIDWFL